MLSWEGLYLFNLNDDPYKKLLICVQQKVIYDGKKYFWKILTLIQMKPTTLSHQVIWVLKRVGSLYYFLMEWLFISKLKYLIYFYFSYLEKEIQKISYIL